MAATVAAGVLLTVPKYVTIAHSPRVTLPKIRPAPTMAEQRTTVVTATPAIEEAAENGITVPRGKKRRLDHMTWEEKIQRKKLKNRVAAQTSRDRKKARMEEMEREIDELIKKTEILQNKCDSLQAINESLLRKNQKLDFEVEKLAQKLNDVQQKQKQQETTNNVATKSVGTCAGCESIPHGSAAGFTSHGLTVDKRTTEKEQLPSVPLEDCCTLPALQDMLLIDEEFDASKLEELAESLLADITADMEASNGACNENVAEIASSTQRLPRSMVGTTTEHLESSQYTNTRSNSIIKTEAEEMSTDALVLQNKLPTEIKDFNGVDSNHITITTRASSPLLVAREPNERQREHSKSTLTPPDTVYGTYDAKTNSITIVLDDDAVPVNEAVEEIYCDGVTPSTDDEIECPTPTSPSQVFLNVECSDDEDEFNFDPIETFLRPKRPLVSPLARSPTLSLHSAISDHGYESIIGSPTSAATEHFDACGEDFNWEGNFGDLFPSLI